MSVSVRELASDDRVRWNELWQGYLRFYGATLPEEISEVTWRRLLTPGEYHEGVAAVDETGRVIGIAHFLFHRSTWTDGWYCYLEDLFVDPAARNRGAGRALIDAVERAARDRGCARMYLATQEFNASARALYDKAMTLAPFVQYRTQMN